MEVELIRFRHGYRGHGNQLPIWPLYMILGVAILGLAAAIAHHF
jgi:hypothetical protein